MKLIKSDYNTLLKILSNFHCNYKNFQLNVISKIKNKKMKSLNCFQTFFYLHRTYRNQIRDFLFLSFCQNLSVCMTVFLSFINFIFPSVCLSVYFLSVCMSICIDIRSGIPFFFLFVKICLFV